MRAAVIACLIVAGCADTRHGNAALGVSDFAVRSTASELEIVGADLQGTVLARLQLRTGMVMPEGWAMPTQGLELSLEIMGKSYPPFATAGLAPLTLPLTADPYLNTFVVDPFVASILTHRGLAFADQARPAPPEVRYQQCSMTTNTDINFAPCTISGVSYGAVSICIDYWGSYQGHELWAQKVVCADPARTRAERLCGAPFTSTPYGQAGVNGCMVSGPVGSAGYGGQTQCSADSCEFFTPGGGGGGGSCHGTICQDSCSSDDECCSCGGYCSPDGLCVY